MAKETIDTTALSREATEASCYFDAKHQFAVPDFVNQLKMAYFHGYRDALMKERGITKRLAVGKSE